MSSTTDPEIAAAVGDRFARRQRTWQNVPGVPAEAAAVLDGRTVTDDREARRTPPGEYLSPKLRGTFFPYAIFQVTVVVFIIFIILLALVVVLPPTVGAPADPLNQEHYLPRPAWYFYFLFQLLEWAKGAILVPIGTFWLPNIAVLALILLPFYDRNPSRKIRKRPLGILFFYGAMLFILLSTVYNVVAAPTQPTTNNQNHAPTQPLSVVPSQELVW